MKETAEKISFKETERPDAVETIFCEPLSLLGEREPLNESVMSVLVALVLSDVEKIKEMLESAKKITGTVAIFEKRSKSLGLNLDDKTIIFFGLISGTPGIAVMYSYYLAHYLTKQAKSNTMTFDDIMVEIFPDGMFTDSTLTMFWEKQKVDTEGKATSDNLLDYPLASKSITFLQDERD